MLFENRNFTQYEHYYMDIGIAKVDYPIHIHQTFECYAVQQGCATAIINGTEYKLLPGEAVLVFPYQRHEYKIESGTKAWVCVFSPNLVGSYKKHISGNPKSNKFLFSHNDKKVPENLMLKKMICYKICGTFDIDAEYTEGNAEKEGLLLKIFHFISENYMGECSLECVAKGVGYDPNYISKFFKKMTGQSCKDYVNGLRIGEACKLLLETNDPISDISDSCGFGSIRSFNREFLAITGKTPREYRNHF